MTGFEECRDLRSDLLVLWVGRLPLGTRVIDGLSHPLGLKRVDGMSFRGLGRLHVGGGHDCAGSCNEPGLAPTQLVYILRLRVVRV